MIRDLLQNWLKPNRPKKSLRRVVPQLETLERRLTPTFVVGPNINITKSTGDDAENAIIINPTNPLNLFATSTGAGAHKYSLDGGATWQDSDLSSINGGVSGGDEQMAWDRFGNLFMTYFSGSNNTTVVALSIDGGATFQLSLNTGNFYDQPSIAVGSDSVWVVYASSSQAIRGAAVSGLGQVGAWSSEQLASGTFGQFGDIAVGPNGEVMIVYQDDTTIFANVDPDGLGPQGLGPQIVVTPTNVERFDDIPAQPNRTIDSEANLAWFIGTGPTRGRVYMVYTNETADENNDTEILVRYSDNNGTTWSAPVRVNDDAVGNGRSQFLPAIAVDQTTGAIAVAWYDCRNDANNVRAEVWMTVSTDGGLTWDANQKVSEGSSVSPGGFDFGDYNKATFHAGKFYMSWGDNSNSTGDNPAGAGGALDVYTAPVTVIIGQPPGFGGGGDFLQIVPSPVNEGSVTVLSGRFSDPDGAGERHFVDVNWGDGTPVERYELFVGQTSFNIPHRFRDNGSFTVNVTVTDELGKSASGSTSAFVNNVAPTATIFGAPLTAAEGQTLNLWGAVTDPGVLDSHTFVWTVTKNGVFYANGNDQAFSFTPDDQGFYRVDFSAIDDDGGIGRAAQARITVTNTAPTGTFTNDGPKPDAPQTVTFTFNAVDGGADLASMRYSYDFNNDGDFTDATDILNSLQPTATFDFAFNGIFTVHGRMTDKEGAFTDLTTTAVVGVPSFYDPTTRYYATGAGFGMQPRVRVFNLNNTPLFDFVAYAPGFQGGVRVATGDVNGDGTEDIITAPGAGGGPHVRVFNGVDGSVVKEFMAPGLPFGYTGGLNVASGDLNSDGRADIILGATTGFVIVVDGASPTNAILGGMNFQPFAGFAGLVSVGSGDQNGDRIMDLVVGAGPGSLPFVRVYGFDFLTGAPLLRNTITAFETTMRGGVSVAIGDVNGDGRGDIIVGSGSQARYLSRVKVFNGANLARTIWNFAPFPGYTGGIQVTAEDLDGDGRDDIVLAPNSGTAARILALNGKNLRRLALFMPFDANFLGGVHVG